MPTFIKTGLWETSTTAQVPKGWLNLTKLIKDNSGGSSENYIPLTGTEEGNPITGDIEILGRENDLRLKWTNGDGDLYNSLYFTSSSMSFLSSNSNEILISGEIGLTSTYDFSGTQPEDKLIYAQRSYVEKPQTLINVLNNCDESQLSTIKSILGIM